MIKVLTWFSRQPGMSVEEFRDYWRNEHPKAVLELPGLRAYNQNPTNDSGYAKDDPFCDGVAETWWDDMETLRSHRGTPVLDALMADEDRFIDPDRRQHLVVSEVVISDGDASPGALKQFTWFKRRADLTPEQCHSYWRDTHGPLAAAVPGMDRYVQNHPLPDQYRDGRQPTFDGVPIVFMNDLQTARTAARSPELAAVRADEANFIAEAGRAMPWIIATEIKIR